MRFCVYLLFSFMSTLLYADDNKNRICGSVRDAYTNNGIEGVAVQLLRPDSTFVTGAITAIAWTDLGGGEAKKTVGAGADFTLPVEASGSYILRFSCVGYEMQYKDVSVKFSRMKRSVDIGNVHLMPAIQQLKEVAVEATKVKMYYNGDTLIYNADAFMVDGKSMLEDLVRQLPGVEIKDGRIYARGRFVENVLISGKDFFTGNPTEALQRLPAYIVNKLKFYDKSGEMSETAGTDMHDGRYVMDIHLKRDFHGMWLGNAALDLGTKWRRGITLYGMRFDDRQAVYLSADYNNLNQDRGSNDLASWSQTSDQGLQTYKKLSGTYRFEQNEKFSLNLSADYQGIDSEYGVAENQEVYLQEGNIVRRTLREQWNKNQSMGIVTSVSSRPKKRIYLKGDYRLGYEKGKFEHQTRTASFNVNPDEFISDWDSSFISNPLTMLHTTNIASDISHGQKDARSHKASFEGHVGFTPHLLKVTANWNKTAGSDTNHSTYNMFTPDHAAGNSSQYRFADNSYDRENLQTEASFILKYVDTQKNSAELTAYYRYEYNREHSDSPFFTDTRFLPSTRDSLQLFIDAENSRWTTNSDTRNIFGVRLTHEYRRLPRKKYLMLTMTASGVASHPEMTYKRVDDERHMNHRFLSFESDEKLTWNPIGRDSLERMAYCWTLRHRLSQRTPSLLQMMEVRDNRDPLNISLGNPDLRQMTTNLISLGFDMSNKQRWHDLNLSAYYTTHSHAVAMSSVYDPQTGVRTTRPVNVDGNYEIGATAYYGLPLDRKKNLWLSFDLSGNYYHSVDMQRSSASGMPAMDADATRSIVHTRQMVGKTAVRYDFHGVNLNYAFKADLRNILTQSQPSTTVADLSNQLEISYVLPWNINTKAACNVITHLGYTDRSMNRSVVLCGLSASRDFGRFNVGLTANDLFHHNDRLTCVLNEQGRLETINTKYLPSYVLAHVYYRWEIASTNKKYNKLK